LISAQIELSNIWAVVLSVLVFSPETASTEGMGTTGAEAAAGFPAGLMSGTAGVGDGALTVGVELDTAAGAAPEVVRLCGIETSGAVAPLTPFAPPKVNDALRSIGMFPKARFVRTFPSRYIGIAARIIGRKNGITPLTARA
jgi:hypothetical protein